MTDERLRQQIDFITEIDKLKTVERRTVLMDRSRRENSAEHSWHLIVIALVCVEYAREENVDMLRVLQMLAIHDLVEIYAGDTFCYDESAIADQAQRERAAARRLFGLLPTDQGQLFLDLWEEFESRSTPEAAFAAALDRFQPLLHNYRTEGTTWREHDVRAEQVMTRNRHIEDGAPPLWQHVRTLIDEAIQRGYLQQ